MFRISFDFKNRSKSADTSHSISLLLILQSSDHHHHEQGQADDMARNSLEITKQFTGILLPRVHHFSTPAFTFCIGGHSHPSKALFKRVKPTLETATKRPTLETATKRPTLETANCFCPQSLRAALLSSEETPAELLDLIAANHCNALTNQFHLGGRHDKIMCEVFVVDQVL